MVIRIYDEATVNRQRFYRIGRQELRLSISFVIDATSGSSAFQLDLVRTDELLIHEEVLENAVKNIEANITRTGIRYDPIVIDEKTSVVLDGTHRTAMAHAKTHSCLR